MPLINLDGAKLDPLIRKHLSTEEDGPTTELMIELRAAKKRGYVTASELATVCYWKSPRAIHHIRSNSPARVRNVTRLALSTRSEQRRLAALTELNGVSVPMASALLTLLDPQRYGVLDIRVWQLLHATRTVGRNARGSGFNFNHWQEFLAILRYLAAKYRVSSRDIERTMFRIHREYQAGRLYGRDPRESL